MPHLGFAPGNRGNGSAPDALFGEALTGLYQGVLNRRDLHAARCIREDQTRNSLRVKHGCFKPRPSAHGLADDGAFLNFLGIEDGEKVAAE